jgi:hypothetical protein
MEAKIMLDNLYDNIGSKIKGFAKLIFIVCSIATIIVGFTLILLEVYSAGIILLILGPIVTWVSSWILYAFGELVEDVHDMRSKYYPQAEENAARAIEAKIEANSKTKALPSALVFVCPECKQIFAGSDYSASKTPHCPNCNKQTRFIGINKSEWSQLSKEERQTKLKTVIEQQDEY